VREGRYVEDHDLAQKVEHGDAASFYGAEREAKG
jgi:hypothetical protein